MKLSIVIPARNEAGNIGLTIEGLREVLKREAIDYEIVLVDDGSTDGTAAEVASIMKLDTSIRLVRNTGLNGFGRAVQCGLNHFAGDAVVIYMADASDSPEDVVKYYHILKNKSDCAFGSRWIRNGGVSNYPLLKRMVNRLANTFIRLLFGIHYNDITNAFKGYRRRVIEGCRPLLSPHFNMTVEIPLKAIVRGYSYSVVPITWKNRRLGQSSLNMKEMGSRYLYIVLIVWLEKLLTKDDYRRRSEKAVLSDSPSHAQNLTDSSAQDPQSLLD